MRGSVKERAVEREEGGGGGKGGEGEGKGEEGEGGSVTPVGEVDKEEEAVEKGKRSVGGRREGGGGGELTESSLSDRQVRMVSVQNMYF